MPKQQSLLRPQQISGACHVVLEAVPATSSDEQTAVGADELKPNVSSSDTAGKAEDWAIVGNCLGTTVLPHNELKEFHRGSRDFIAWGVAISALVFLAAMLFG